MFKNATYTIQFNKWGLPEVTIDMNDGFRMDFSEVELEEAVKNIRQKRHKYADQAEWVTTLAVYEGALKFLREQVEVEQRR